MALVSLDNLMKETKVISDLSFALDILTVYYGIWHQLGDSPER